GSASVYGALIGAFVMQIGPNQSTEFQQYALVFYGVLLVACGVLFRGGLSTLGTRLLARLDRAAGVRPAPRVRDPDPDGAAGDALDEITGAELTVDAVSKRFGGNQALS